MADIKVVQDSLKDMTIVTVHGILSAEEIIATVKEFYAGHPTRLVLWDMTGATTSGDIATDRLKEIINTAKKSSGKRPKGKTAIVISADIDYGLGRVFQVHAEFNLPYKYSIFRDVAEARSWLLDDSSV